MLIKNLALVVAICLFIVAPAKAGIIFDFDFDLITTGVQNTLTANPGDTFQVGVVMLLTGPADVTSFSFDIDFDTQFVSVNPASVVIPTRPTGYEQLVPVVVNNITGRIGNFAGGPPISSTIGAPPNNVVTLGVFSFTAMNSTTSQSTGAIMRYFNTGTDAFGGVAGVTFTSNASTLAVTAVPEPSTLACLATLASASGLLRVRKRNRFENISSTDASFA